MTTVKTLLGLPGLRLRPRTGADLLDRPVSRIYDIFPPLKERQGSRGTDLSGGEQQMLAIARANPRSQVYPAR